MAHVTYKIQQIITVPSVTPTKINEKQWESVEKHHVNQIGKRLFVSRLLSSLKTIENGMVFTDYITEQVQPNEWKRTIVNFKTGDPHPYPYY